MLLLTTVQLPLGDRESVAETVTGSGVLLTVSVSNDGKLPLVSEA
jgi:hypothetical protein